MFGLHQSKKDAAQSIRAFLFENRLYNKRSVAEAISHLFKLYLVLLRDILGCRFLFHRLISLGFSKSSVSPLIPNQYNPNLFPIGNGFGLFVFFERYENTHFRNGVQRKPTSKPKGPRHKNCLHNTRILEGIVSLNYKHDEDNDSV